MFGRRFWGAAFFGPRYWGPAGEVVTPPTPEPPPPSTQGTFGGGGGHITTRVYLDAREPVKVELRSRFGAFKSKGYIEAAYSFAGQSRIGSFKSIGALDLLPLIECEGSIRLPLAFTSKGEADGLPIITAEGAAVFPASFTSKGLAKASLTPKQKTAFTNAGFSKKQLGEIMRIMEGDEDFETYLKKRRQKERVARIMMEP